MVRFKKKFKLFLIFLKDQKSMNIGELLAASFQQASTQQLANITETIKSLYPNPNFYQECVNIISDESVNITLRKSALINITNGVKSCWAQTFSPEMKNYIMTIIPDLISRSSPDLLRSFEKLSDIVVKFIFINNQWTELFNFSIILPQLYQQDYGHLLAGLILTKSVTKYIKNPTRKLLDFYSNFASVVLPLIANICQTCEDLTALSFAYHCLSRLFFVSSDDAQAFISPFIGHFYTKFMTEASKASSSPLTETTVMFLLQGVKFLDRVAKERTNLTNDQIIPILSLLKMVLSLNVTGPLKGKAICLLNTLINEGKRHQILEGNMQSIIELIFVQLMINEEDVSDMENDPFNFIESNPDSCPNWEEIKSSCYRFISNCAKSFPPLINFVFQVASTSCQSNNRFQIFTAFRLLSAAMKGKAQENFNNFLPMLVAACNHDDFVIRAGAFLVISQLSKIRIPTELLQLSIAHLNDQSQLVTYYAANALSQCLYLIQKQPEYEEVKQALSPQIEAIYTIFCNISSQFNDSSSSEALSTLVLFFKEMMLPYSSSLFQQITALFVNTSLSSEVSTSGIETTASDALLKLIKLVGKNPESAMSFYPSFYSQITQAFAATQQCSTVELLFPLLSNLINLSPAFDESFWGLIDPLMQTINNHDELDLDDIYPIIDQLIFRDVNLPSKEQVVKNLCMILFSSDFLSCSTNVFSSLIMRCGDNIPCLPELISRMEEEASGFDHTESIEAESIANIFSAMVLSCSNYPTQFINIWVSQHPFPFYIASLLKLLPQLPEDPLMRAQAINAGFQSILKADDDDDDDFDFDGEDEDDDEITGNEVDDIVDDFQVKPGEFNISTSANPQWLDDKALVQQFYELINQLHAENSPVIQAIVQQIGPEALANNMKLLQVYPNHKQLMKKMK
ncbi:hypothetical protein TRFO_29977 [Tritrichomonas foetus]|uniref:Importin N-terminal domain-containing protein n=1 Tax=Tritrichomonas foetus TaxID=1144522 RepID=A0A1J4JZ66_9EUKA|nr:hypothetical protein TRFO_29977 [Tritrichomonas foetus]|eukprot:OHT02782.1 hypothetical protein TRFO_29977 [Tritrichomonas foetus]